MINLIIHLLKMKLNNQMARQILLEYHPLSSVIIQIISIIQLIVLIFKL